jgi:DNA-binding FadR family transcriptional regulator
MHIVDTIVAGDVSGARKAMEDVIIEGRDHVHAAYAALTKALA